MSMLKRIILRFRIMQMERNLAQLEELGRTSELDVDQQKNRILESYAYLDTKARWLLELTPHSEARNRSAIGQIRAFLEFWRNCADALSASNKKSIRRPPGVWLLHFAEFIYSKKKFEDVLLPTIVDMREEYFEALAAERTWKARWVLVRGHWSFWAAVGMDIPISALGLIRKIWTAAN